MTGRAAKATKEEVTEKSGVLNKQRVEELIFLFLYHQHVKQTALQSSDDTATT